MTTAVLFPGQGSQEPDMRDRVAAARPDLLDALEAAVGCDPFARVEDGTAWAQPAIFAACLAAWAEREPGAEPPAWLAGHSLGELTALTVAGALGERDAIALVALRGRLMQNAPEGGMLAVMRTGAAEAAPALAAEHGLSVANDNAPMQVVLSGPLDALPAASEAAAAAGLKPMDLPVAGAFHSPLMEPAVVPFRAALDDVVIHAPGIPVLSCVTLAPVEGPGGVRDVLANGIVRPARFREAMLDL